MADDKGQFGRTDQAERDGFAQLLCVEWAKFRTSRRRVIGMVIAALVIVSLGLLIAANFHMSFEGPNGEVHRSAPLGPHGEAVIDRFYFMHQPLTGDGSITARVPSLTGIITYPPPNHDQQFVSGVVPWAKAGVLIKRSTNLGSAYAAVMLTGTHGVRMQYNFTEDIAGRPGSVSEQSPRWLRLTRLDDTLTGYESSDGTQWTKIGTAHLAGLPAPVEAGLFVTSPCNLTLSEGACRFTQATAAFDHVSLEGNASGKWSGDNIGRYTGMTDWERFHRPAGFEESDGKFTVSGSGDIAPAGFGEGLTIQCTLIGTFLGAIVVIVVAATFSTAGYQRNLNRTAPDRPPAAWRMLAAKAIVIGAVTFVAGLAAALVAVLLGVQILRSNGNDLLPVTLLTKLRLVGGTAALLALFAILALALGALFRRHFVAVAAAIAVIIVPYVAAIALVLPGSESQWELRQASSRWLLRLTPAAGFAIQQSIPEYAHVVGPYTPVFGYYPLAPWGGFAVSCGYTALALGLAGLMLRHSHAAQARATEETPGEAALG
jgi:hypothetical protein